MNEKRVRGVMISMRRIVLDLQSGLFADAVSQTLGRSEPDFLIIRSESPDKTLGLCRSGRAYAVLMEVTVYPPWRLEERLRLCGELRKLMPECRILLLVDEVSSDTLALGVKQAKKDGYIDGFVYASISPAYLAALLDTL